MQLWYRLPFHKSGNTQHWPDLVLQVWHSSKQKRYTKVTGKGFWRGHVNIILILNNSSSNSDGEVQLLRTETNPRQARAWTDVEGKSARRTRDTGPGGWEKRVGRMRKNKQNKSNSDDWKCKTTNYDRSPEPQHTSNRLSSD